MTAAPGPAPAPRALVVAPHPDDEVLGAGGTIAVLVARGWEVVVVAVCADLPPLYPADVAPRVRAEALAAHRLLGVSASHFLDLPSVELSRGPVSALNGPLQGLVDSLRPALVLLPFPDRHVDHRAVFDAGMVATRPIGTGTGIRLVALYETVSETFWNAPGAEPTSAPTWHVDVTGTIGVKTAAFACFASQLQADPGPRSRHALEALAAFRGSQIGVAHAESFTVVRMVTSAAGAGAEEAAPWTL